MMCFVERMAFAGLDTQPLSHWCNRDQT